MEVKKREQEGRKLVAAEKQSLVAEIVQS